MDEYERICMGIIANAGTATGYYVEAMRLAIAGQIDEAKAQIEEGGKNCVEAHKTHMEILTKEASGDPVKLGLLLVHADDQLNKAEILEIMAQQMVDLCSKK